MRADLAKRLQKVARVIRLLKKIALSEGQFIDRASKRSLIALQKFLGKFEEALNRFSASPEANGKVMALLEQVISRAGVVDQEAANTDKPSAAIREVSKVAPPLAGAAARLMAAAFMAARMQNADRVELAKVDPRYRDNFMRAQEKLTDSLQRMDKLIREVKFPEQPKEAPAAEEKKEDSSGLEGLTNQINEAHADMLKTVQAMSQALVRRVETLFPDDTSMIDALHQNITAAMPGGEPGQSRKVNPLLNTDQDFYRDVLELQKAADYDLGEFLRTKNRKLVYQAYRSVIMAMRALGVMQWAKARPDIVMKSTKALKLLIKAQEILKKRKGLVVDRLTRLKAEEDEDEEDRGVPKGTFQQSFEEAPKGTFESAA